MKTIKEIRSWFYQKSDDLTKITSLSNNSKCRQKNWLYLAYKGREFDGNDYIDEARKNGAVAYLSDREIPDLKDRLEDLAYNFYGLPDIELIGVTGTAGKSSTAYLLSRIYNALGSKTLLITATANIPDSVFSSRTTPDPLLLYPLLWEAKKNGYQRVVMECSSIGMATKRIDLLNFKDILMTPITSDHLDFHKTKRNYRRTKINYVKFHADHIYMLKNNRAKKYFRRKSSLITLDSHIHNARYLLEGSTFVYQNVEFTTSFVLPFNIENLLLILGYFIDKGFDIAKLQKVVSILPTFPGRMEKVIDKVFIDYAHTGSAVKRVLKETGNISGGFIVAVIGAGGERDTKKRKAYRRALKKYADIVILTNDNPRNEDAQKILNEIKGHELFGVIPDRKTAVEFALNLQIPDKIVLILGKGDESFQEIKGKKIHFSDREVIQKWQLK